MTSTQELEAAAGQLLVVGFQGVEAPPEAITGALSGGRIGGVILFSRNIGPGDEGLEALARLNEALDACRPPDGAGIFIGVDQEGGRVRRLRHERVTPMPPMLAVGEVGDPRWTSAMSEALATELAALGFNLNFAPVLDVWTNPDNGVIGDRAFGRDPETVAIQAGAWTAGHTIAGVLPCGKHFPGHGDTLADSHHELPVLDHDIARLLQVELVPFRRAIKAGMPLLMTAHILLPKIDPDHPITLSKPGLTGLLRQRLRFDGVVISDDLEMRAVADRYEIEEIVERGLMAGVDIFLICHTEDKWRRAFDHLVALAERDPQARQRLLESAARVRRLKANYLPRAPYTVPEGLMDELGPPAHRALLDRLAPEA